ncbi:MAG: CpaF family protein, partial [Firmicutes bacterium]|nr:CpaF family protein [Bacillota bacterium]
MHTLADLREQQERDARRDGHRERVLLLHKRVIAELKNLAAPAPEGQEDLHRRVADLVQRLIDQEGWALPRGERHRLAAEVVDEVLGFGPLTPLLNDPE